MEATKVIGRVLNVFSEVYDAIVAGLSSVDIDTWLQVIPQLIARIDSSRSLVQLLVHQLLIDIGKSHPQVIHGTPGTKWNDFGSDKWVENTSFSLVQDPTTEF